MVDLAGPGISGKGTVCVRSGFLEIHSAAVAIKPRMESAALISYAIRSKLKGSTNYQDAAGVLYRKVCFEVGRSALS